MQDWETFKLAALEYSKLKPRKRLATITTVIDLGEYGLPADCLSVQYVAYGERATFIEVVTNAGADQGWADEEGTLYITPLPTEELPVQMVYYGLHIGNEDTQLFPTIPAADLHHVDDLEQAIRLEIEADEMAGGPVSYSIGQTEVDRTAAITDLRARAQQLRHKVENALGEPLALWR